MSDIKRFIIDQAAANLALQFDDDNPQRETNFTLSFEYLRVFAPTDDKGQSSRFPPAVYHKKQVQLLKIESVAKHGYRLLFDDGYSGIYSPDYLLMLATQFQQHWQQYLNSTSNAINSREATIAIKEVK
ncbi:DUF971 family protein [Colwellia chukchiensis]|uniref:DUF971 family protein n=1 Tax=Colwellia chukchiensis TaxID=641665 RepID=A0A1H7REL7_9GAMM|nr:gamma-butyrobetaine hydroxylase-like domain-containing protein [Colwellia chukchiensis]SEL58428.1 DUF971 family protein [Colwellia chukchiensis]